MKKLKRQDIDLVHVVWGETDQGVVSLKQGRWLLYVWGDSFGGHHAVIPTIGISDEDFKLIMEPVADDPDCFEATWDDVPKLLHNPRFPLLSRIDNFGLDPNDLLLLKTA